MKKHRDFRELKEVLMRNSDLMRDFVKDLNKWQRACSKNSATELTNLSDEELMECGVKCLSDLQRQLERLEKMLSSYEKAGNGGFAEYHPLIIHHYKETKSAYKCQEELKQLGVDISIPHIYTILDRYHVKRK